VLVFRVVAARSRSQLDGNLLIYDARTGRELAANNDTFGADPFLAFKAPAQGEYVVELRDLRYRGGADFDYRIEAGAIPFVQSLSPMSGRRRQVLELKATGYNLAGGERVTLDLTHVPAGAVPVRVTTSAGVSNEISFEVTEAPQATEAEPNDDPKSGTRVALGTDLSGVIGRPNDVDVFTFRLDQPTRVLAEAFAARVGSPLDPLLTIHDGPGQRRRHQ
jgi:hypothetical protein